MCVATLRARYTMMLGGGGLRGTTGAMFPLYVSFNKNQLFYVYVHIITLRRGPNRGKWDEQMVRKGARPISQQPDAFLSLINVEVVVYDSGFTRGIGIITGAQYIMP